jgi:hypothetical protein
MTFPLGFFGLRFSRFLDRNSLRIWEEDVAVELGDHELARLNSRNLRDLDSAVWDSRRVLLVTGGSNR